MPKLCSSSTSYSQHFGLLPLWFLSALRAGKMKSKASRFLKQLLSQLASIVKAKSAAVRTKTTAVKTRLIIFSLLHDKKELVSAISGKIHTLVAPDKDEHVTGTPHDDTKKMSVPCNAAGSDVPKVCNEEVESSCGDQLVAREEEEDPYPDLRHALFDDEDGVLLGDDGTGSVIDLVKNSRGQDQGEFVLEDEIDHVADLFIKRFHMKLRMQRLESFKRHQETTLEGGA